MSLENGSEFTSLQNNQQFVVERLGKLISSNCQTNKILL